MRENRFTVGGVIEFIVEATPRACGVPVRHRGAVEKRLDLPFCDGTGGYSVKTLLKSKHKRIRVHPARTHTSDIAARILIHYPQLFQYLPVLEPGQETEVD